MAIDTNVVGGNSGNKQEVNALFHAKTVTETDAITNPGNLGGVRNFSENDQGTVTGVTKLASAEVDTDYRLRVSQDLMLDEEVFNYTAQNTGKHSGQQNVMVFAYTAGNLTLNSGSSTASGAFCGINTYAFFPAIGTQTLSADTEVAFSAQPTTNTFVEFGIGLGVAANAAPTDGVFIRLSSAGLIGVISSNGTETTVAFPLADGAGNWAYTNNKKYQFITYVSAIAADFWVNAGAGAVKLGSIPLPAGQGRLLMGSSGHYFARQRITGGVGGAVLQTLLGAYCVRLGGSALTTTVSVQGNRLYGSYQGLSGGTMGSLATYANSTNPTAAAPSNTALTANLPGGLGGQGAVTAAAAAATDGIWSSYQVPAGTVSVPGRRLVLRGYKLDCVNMGAAVATTATTIQFSLAFGHTAVSLATADGLNTKAPRRVALGIASWLIGAAIGEPPKAGPIFLDLGDAPIFVNPGEFIALVGKFLAGTATASQVINFTATPIYGWE